MGGILLLMIVFSIIFAVFFSSNRIAYKNTFFSERKIKWLLVIYVGLFVVSTVVYAILPKDFYAYELDGQLQQSDPSKVEMDNMETEVNFYEAVADGTLDELEEVYVKGQWEFDIEEDFLPIKSDEYFGGYVFVEQKEINDHKMEVTYYTTDSIIAGINFTDEIEPPRIEMLHGILQIYRPERKEIEFQRFDKEAIIGQFSGEPWFSSTYTFSYHGQQMLYVKIPKDLKLDENNLYLDYVKDTRQ